ncbi:MAG: AAA family ATPase [Ruminococcaceae bacterium]|nr:AAA family ATPase [Oscillospiraceae bacterium]
MDEEQKTPAPPETPPAGGGTPDTDEDPEAEIHALLREVKEEAMREAVNKTLEKIDALVGAEDFKRFCHELAEMAQSEHKAYAKHFIERCAICFFIGSGDGFSTYITLLAELLKAAGLKNVRETDHVSEIRKAMTDENITNVLPKAADRSELLGINMEYRVERAGTERLRAFLRALYRERGELLPVFKLPFSEARRGGLADDIAAVFPVAAIRVPPFTTEEYARFAADEFARLGFRLDPGAREAVESLIVDKRNREHFYGFHSVRALAEDIAYQKNLSETRGEKEMSLVIREEDLQSMLRRCKSEQGGLEALSEMIGVDEIRARIDEIVAQLELAQNLSAAEKPCMHMLFTGNPGTGKTTVARILGRVLKEKGVLSKGQFFERTGRDFVGRYIGETTPITNAICRDAYGSVLFIDEAYTLFRSGGSERDFGREAIDALITQMENHRQDLIVIFSGYEKEMKVMLEANPGLAGRIPHEIRFRDFTREELAAIFMNMAGRTYRCAEGLAEEVNRYFLALPDEILSEQGFSNARFVRNLYERTVAKAALRHQAEHGERIGSDAAIELTGGDFRAAAGAAEFRTLQEKPTRAIGFV